jgi:hypothetical protein
MAINFPTSPTNGDIHTAEGIQWQWDNTGSTWKCQGVTGVYTLGIASANSLGGIKIGNNLSIDGTGVLSAVMNLNNESISELTDVTFNSVTLNGSSGGGKVLAWDQSLQAFAPVDQSGGGGGGGGSSTFVGLTDTPGSMGSAGQFLTVNSGANALEFTAAPAGTLSGLTDTDFTAVAPQTLDFLAYNGTNWTPNPISLLVLSDVFIISPSDGDVLTYNNSAARWQAAAPSGGGGGGAGLTSRATANGTASNLADDGSANIDITAAKTYALLKIQTSHAAWVTLYTSDTTRTQDQNRLEVTDPQPGSGVIAEVITTDGATQTITPGTIGWNDDGVPSTTAYVKVVNKSGSTQNLTVTLHFVQLEV